MTIHDIARETGLTKRAIKFYEEEGLLMVPKAPNGYRSYSPDHVRQLREISLNRRLGLSVADIRDLLETGDRSVLTRVLADKEQELRERRQELEDLRAFIAGEEAVCPALDYSSAAEAILEAVPGFYGHYFLHHFLPYLQEAPRTPEQREALQTILDFWDNTQLRIPWPMRLSGWLAWKFSPTAGPEEMERKATEQLRRWLDPAPEQYERLKKQVLEGYRTKRLLRWHPAYVSQRRFMRELQDKGYNDIFIPAVKRLSPAYRAYHDAITAVNDRICRELGLYYDSDFNLVRRKAQ